MFDSAKQALDYISEHHVAMIDLKIGGIAGQWLHITIPAKTFTAGHFEEGVGYDGSSGSGFGTIESGDVAAVPVPQTAFVDPFFKMPTLSFICRTVTADTKVPIANDPRTIAENSVRYLQSLGFADTAWMAPEFEFHVFDRLDVLNTPYQSHVSIDAPEVATEGDTPPIAAKQGYLRSPPGDRLHDLRTEISMTLDVMGVPVRYHHHEVGAPGQCEIEVELAPLVMAADRAMLIKYVAKNVAHRHGKLATFMPKPVYGEAGNGMHVHQKLALGDKPIFYDNAKKNYADLSDLALHYIAGLLENGCALTGLTNPSTNSFKRLVPGCEAPVNLFFSLANRSAAIRVPRYAVSPQEKRIEYRPPDFTGNVYLSLAGMLMAGIDGIQRELYVPSNHFGPYDVDIAKQSEKFLSKITPIPRSLYDAMDALAKDHDFLCEGEVFPRSFVEHWVSLKRLDETEEIAVRPHPYEYELYLDT